MANCAVLTTLRSVRPSVLIGLVVCAAFGAAGCDFGEALPEATGTTTTAEVKSEPDPPSMKLAKRAVRVYLRGDQRGTVKLVDCFERRGSRRICAVEFRNDCDLYTVTGMADGSLSVTRGGFGICTYTTTSWTGAKAIGSD